MIPAATQRLPRSSSRRPSPPRPLPKSKTRRRWPRLPSSATSKAQILRLPPGRRMAVDDVERLAVGRHRQPVGPLDVGLRQDARDRAVGVDAVDGLGVHLQLRAVVAVERVGEPDAALGVGDDVVGAVVPLALVALGQDLDGAGLQVGADDAPAAAGALLGPLATDQPALRVEGVAVGPAAVGAEDRDDARRRHPVDAVGEDVAEEEVARGRRRRAPPAGRGGPRPWWRPAGRAGPPVAGPWPGRPGPGRGRRIGRRRASRDQGRDQPDRHGDGSLGGRDRPRRLPGHCARSRRSAPAGRWDATEPFPALPVSCENRTDVVRPGEVR